MSDSSPSSQYFGTDDENRLENRPGDAAGADGRIGRRAFLRGGALVMLAGAGALDSTLLAKDEAAPTTKTRLGLLTDIHYADKPTSGKRHYRDSLGKVREAIDRFNGEKLDVAVELGDFVDRATDAKTELGYLERIEAEFARFRGERHYVLGNHCVDTLTKGEFLSNCGAKLHGAESYYSFDHGGVHFVVLDACFRADGTPYGKRNFTWTDTEIPGAEQTWLAKDLKKTELPTVVFVHQRIDVSTSHGVKSGPTIRKLLEGSGKVLAVFQGHNHVNDHKEIGGIHYVTLAAVVEGPPKDSSAYAMLDIFEGGALRLNGFRKQATRSLSGPAKKS